MLHLFTVKNILNFPLSFIQQTSSFCSEILPGKYSLCRSGLGLHFNMNYEAGFEKKEMCRFPRAQVRLCKAALLKPQKP